MQKGPRAPGCCPPSRFAPRRSLDKMELLQLSRAQRTPAQSQVPSATLGLGQPYSQLSAKG